MPIKLAKDFPATKILQREDIFAIDEQRAAQQDIRPLKILILNLMPLKIDTETQLLRLISQNPLQIDVDFLKVDHDHKHTSSYHLAKFYLGFPQVKSRCYDGLIITGAPVEQLAFEEVDYWEELQAIMDWSQTNVTSVVHICWGAQAGLYHHYGIDKIAYQEKLFGIYPQTIQRPHRLFRGFNDVFETPQSRYTGIDERQIEKSNVDVIAGSEEIGATILLSEDEQNIFLLGHFEYDTDSLKKEYLRDQERGLTTKVPVNYFSQAEDSASPIINNWRSSAYLFFHNWINDVYQLTPFDLAEIPQYNQLKHQG